METYLVSPKDNVNKDNTNLPHLETSDNHGNTGHSESSKGKSSRTFEQIQESNDLEVIQASNLLQHAGSDTTL